MPRVLAIMFLLFCLAATLFPPFIWGEELLKGPEARLNLSQSGVGLPIKKYAFLFGDSKQRFNSGLWRWDNEQKQSVPIHVTLQRRLLLPELILEYVSSSFDSSLLRCLVKNNQKSENRRIESK